MLAGIIGSLGLGTGLALLFELLDTTLRRSDQLQKMTNAPVLSRIPKLKPLTISDTVFDD